VVLVALLGAANFNSVFGNIVLAIVVDLIAVLF
jgi:hypothetical protein